MKRIGVDTNIAIDFLNGNFEIVSLLETFDEICIPITVCGELLFGAMNSTRRIDNIQNFKSFISACTILSVNLLVAENYAAVRKELKDRGRPIPENDIWIAAICLSHNLPLITKDKHFKEISSLTLVPHNK